MIWEDGPRFCSLLDGDALIAQVTIVGNRHFAYSYTNGTLTPAGDYPDLAQAKRAAELAAEVHR